MNELEIVMDLDLKVVVSARPDMIYQDCSVFSVVIEINRRVVFEREYTNAGGTSGRRFAFDTEAAKHYAVTAFADRLKEVLS